MPLQLQKFIPHFKSPAGWRGWLQEFAAIFLWVYAITKLLVIDFDHLIVSKFFPRLVPLLWHKFPIFVGIFVVGLFWPGRKRLLQFTVFVFTYPIRLCWRLLWLALRHWHIAVLFAPAIHDIVTSFKKKCAVGILTLMAAAVVAWADSTVAIGVGTLMLGTYLIAHLLEAIKRALVPSTILSAIIGEISRENTAISKTVVQRPLADLKGLDRYSDEYGKKYMNALLFPFLMNQGLKMLAERLQKIVSSPLVEVYLFISWLRTVCYTIGIFALLYFGIERIWPGSFVATNAITFWSFLGYSLNTALSGSISEVRPVSGLAITMSYCELIAAVLNLAFFVGIFFARRGKHQKEGLTLLKQQIDHSAKLIDDEMQKEFQLSLDIVERALLKTNAALVNKIRELRGLGKLSLDDAIDVLSRPPEVAAEPKQTAPENKPEGE